MSGVRQAGTRGPVLGGHQATHQSRSLPEAIFGELNTERAEIAWYWRALLYKTTQG